MPDEHNATIRQSQDCIAAAFALIDAIRDNVFLEPWAVDELLDVQPSNEHAKALLVMLGAHDLIPRDECEIAVIDRGLGAV